MSGLVPVVLVWLDQCWVSWRAGAWQPRWPLDPQCFPFSLLRGVSCSSSSHPCSGNVEKDSKSPLCHFPDVHSRHPGLNEWLMTTSHRWPYPVFETVVTFHSATWNLSDARSSSKQTAFNLGGGAKDSGGGSDGVEKHSRWSIEWNGRSLRPQCHVRTVQIWLEQAEKTGPAEWDGWLCSTGENPRIPVMHSGRASSSVLDSVGWPHQFGPDQNISKSPWNLVQTFMVPRWYVPMASERCQLWLHLVDHLCDVFRATLTK